MTTPKNEWEERFDEEFANVWQGNTRFVAVGLDDDNETLCFTNEQLKAFIRAEKKESYLDGLAEGQSWDEQHHDSIRKQSEAETLKKVLEVVEVVEERSEIRQMKPDGDYERGFDYGYDVKTDELRRYLTDKLTHLQTNETEL